MKKYYILMLLIITIMLSGCSGKAGSFKLEDTIKNEDGVFYSTTFKDESIKGYSKEIQEEKTEKAVKKGMKDVSEFAKKQNKNFAIVNEEINNLIGFPVNNYTDLKTYCFKKDRNGIKIYCSSVNKPGAIKINFVLVDNTDYRISSFNPDSVLEEINNEK